VMRFRRDFPDAATYLLERNYRSTQNILDAATAVIARNPERTAKRLWTDGEAGARITLFEAHNDTEEADFVLHQIEALRRQGSRLGDFAVMYRTNAQSRAVEDALVRRRVPYMLVGASRFYDRREIRDVMAYLRVLHNPRDDVALERIVNVPPRGVGPKALETLKEWSAGEPLWTGLERLASGTPPPGAVEPDGRALKALVAFHDLISGLMHAAKAAPPADLLTTMLVRTGYLEWIRDSSPEGEERWENIRELRSVADEFADLEPEAALPAMLEQVALVADVDELVESPERITLLTFHAAKGLEFDTVFIVGAEEGFLPHSRSRDDPAAVQEERRLFYVGITRARTRLYVSHAVRRLLYGLTDARQPSRFLADLPPAVVAKAGAAAGGKSRPAARPVTRWAANPAAAGVPAERGFRAGDRVRHAAFGSGVVVTAGERDGDEEVTVAFAGVGVKKLLASLAHLERQA
jgi:DNA helicase-2/ATP-dependent DNA helicase PcrA